MIRPATILPALLTLVISHSLHAAGGTGWAILPVSAPSLLLGQTNICDILVLPKSPNPSDAAANVVTSKSLSWGGASIQGVCEPDDYPEGTLMNDVCPGVTLSTDTGGNVFSTSAGYPSTGTLVFKQTHSGGEVTPTRAVFDVPMQNVEIFGRNDSPDSSQGTTTGMSAYDMNDTWVDNDFQTTYSGQQGGATVSSVSPNIAYVGMFAFPAGDIDHLTFSRDAIVDVYLDTTNPPMTVICADTTLNACDPGPLQPVTTYYWQIVVKDPCQDAGPIWSFTTGCFDNSDSDCDGVLDPDDNCPAIPNPDQSDTDIDGTGDVCDNCPNDPNPTQDDLDSDGTGDVCDDDLDGDGVPNIVDNCPNNANANQLDSDGDGVGDVCSTVVPADHDADFDVDGTDFTTFASCFNKAGNPPRTLGCDAAAQAAFDFDDDNDIDGVDFATFASCFNGAGKPPRTLGCPQN